MLYKMIRANCSTNAQESTNNITSLSSKMPAIPMQTTISPNDQAAVCTRPLTNEEQLDVVIADAIKAQKSWKKVSIDDKIQIAEKWMVSQLWQNRPFRRLTDTLLKGRIRAPKRRLGRGDYSADGSVSSICNLCRLPLHRLNPVSSL
jgi:hypothetical protein